MLQMNQADVALGGETYLSVLFIKLLTLDHMLFPGSYKAYRWQLICFNETAVTCCVYNKFWESWCFIKPVKFNFLWYPHANYQRYMLKIFPTTEAPVSRVVKIKYREYIKYLSSSKHSTIITDSLQRSPLKCNDTSQKADKTTPGKSYPYMLQESTSQCERECWGPSKGGLVEWAWFE